MAQAPRIAVLLSGCGVFDGAEIHESVLTLLALDRRGARVGCFAPDRAQHHVVDHVSGQEVPGAERNVLVEAARIARGAIEALDAYRPEDFDALILPGGFGVAKNLCTFAMDGADCRVMPEVAQALRATHDQKRPIGAWCIAPVLLARLFGDVEVTIGQDAEVAGALTAMGARHAPADHAQVVVDRAARLVTTPCYMLDATISQIADGTERGVAAVLDLIVGR